MNILTGKFVKSPVGILRILAIVSVRANKMCKSKSNSCILKT